MKLSRAISDGIIFGVRPAMSESLPENFTVPDALVSGHWDGTRLVYGGTRTDGYHFFGYCVPGGQDVIVMAGCRQFTLREAYEHWGQPGYPLGAESLAIVNNIENALRFRGLLTAAKPAPVPAPAGSDGEKDPAKEHGVDTERRGEARRGYGA